MTNKDIIKQYVDTGMLIPEYQFDKLTIGLLRTYLRKRIIAAKNDQVMPEDLIQNYEFNKLNKDEKDKIIPFINIKYDKMSNDELEHNIRITLDFIYNCKSIPDFMLHEYNPDYINNLFSRFLDQYKSRNMDMTNLIEEMMETINSDSSLKADISYGDEFYMYLSRVPKDKIDWLMKFFIKNGYDEWGEELDDDAVSHVIEMCDMEKKRRI